MSQINLSDAIVKKLIEDTGAGSLVEITGHDVSTGKLRIGRDMPPHKQKTPFLGVSIFSSEPLSESATFMQNARIHLKCYSADEFTCVQLADRMEYLLHGRTEEAVAGFSNRGYYNFADVAAISPALIRCMSTRYKGRGGVVFDHNTDVYLIVIQADVIWSDDPC